MDLARDVGIAKEFRISDTNPAPESARQRYLSSMSIHPLRLLALLHPLLFSCSGASYTSFAIAAGPIVYSKFNACVTYILAWPLLRQAGGAFIIDERIVMSVKDVWERVMIVRFKEEG
jgi:hypothetical protein